MVESQSTLTDIIFETTSALGISGLSVGISQPNLLWQGKLVLIFIMWAGRLEIIAVLILFASLFPFLRPKIRRRQTFAIKFFKAIAITIENNNLGDSWK